MRVETPRLGLSLRVEEQPPPPPPPPPPPYLIFWLYFSHCHFIFSAETFSTATCNYENYLAICNLISEKYDFVSIWPLYFLTIWSYTCNIFPKGIREVVCGQIWWPILGICALHLTHPSATHTVVNIHLEQWAANASGARGAVWGFGALLKGLTSVVVLKVERALFIHSPHLQSLPDLRTHDLRVTSPTLYPLVLAQNCSYLSQLQLYISHYDIIFHNWDFFIIANLYLPIAILFFIIVTL